MTRRALVLAPARAITTVKDLIEDAMRLRPSVYRRALVLALLALLPGCAPWGEGRRHGRGHNRRGGRR